MSVGRRPLLLCIGSFLSLFVFPFFVKENLLHTIFSLAVGLLLSLFFLLFRKNRRMGERIALSLIALIFCLCGAVGGRHFTHHKIEKVASLADGTSHLVTGYVREILYEEPFGTGVYVTLDTVDGIRTSGSISLTLPFASGLSPYDILTFSAKLQQNEAKYDTYLKSKGVLLSAEAEEFTLEGKRKPDLFALTSRARGWIMAQLDRLLGKDAAGFATALLTGNKESLDGQTALAFKRLGISHLLAVSGLHLSVIVGRASLLLRKLTVSKRKRIVLLTLLMLLNMIVCGFSPSILRASIMLMLLYFSELVGEQHDSLTALFAAVFLIVLLRPFASFDGGLWLSFSATLGILLVLPMAESILQRMKGRNLGIRLLRYVATLLVITVAATFFTLPVLTAMDGSISLLSSLANLIFVPIVGILLPMLVLLLLFSWVPYLPTVLGIICRTVIEHTASLAERLSDTEGICVSLRYPFIGALAVALIVALLIVFSLRRHRPAGVIAVFLAFGLAFCGSVSVYRGRTNGEVRIFLETDGKSDMVGFLHEGRSVLLDVSTGGKAVPLSALDTLDELCFCETDLLILTHLHSNHICTLPRLADRTKLRHILLPVPETEGERDIANAVSEAMAGISKVSFYPRDGDSRITLGRLTLHLPDYRTLSRSTHPAVQFSAEVEGVSKKAFVYAGASTLELPALYDLTGNAVLTVCGTNGPSEKHIFSISAFENTDNILVLDEGLLSLTEEENIESKVLTLDGKRHFEILFTE